MPGLLSNALDDDSKTVSGYDPAKSDVDASKGTVQGQLTSLLKTDSPLLTQARTSADQQMQKRGLLNSSLAVTASDDAAYRAALPIAGADATTYNNNRLTQDANTNQALGFNANALNQAGQQQTAGEQQQAAITKQGEVNTGLQTLQGQQQKENIALQGSQEQALQGLRGDQAKAIAQLQADSAQSLQALQTNVTAASLYTQLLQSMTSIQGNPNIDAAGKQQMMTNMTQWLQSGLGLIGGISGYDLGSLLNFGGA